jgi:hypothetical protein
MKEFFQDRLVIVAIVMGAFSFVLFWKRNHKNIHDMEDVLVKAAGLGLLVAVGTFFGLIIAKIAFDGLL